MFCLVLLKVPGGRSLSLLLVVWSNLEKVKKKDITLAAHFFVCFFLVCWSVGGASYWQLQTIGWAELRGAEGCWMFGQNTENQKYLAAKPSSWCFGCVVG